MAEIEFDKLNELVEEEVNEATESSESNMPNEPNEPNEPEPVSNKEKLMRSLVSDDDEVDEMKIDSIRQMLDSAPRWFLSQWKMMLLCLVGIFFYITNGYQAQVEMMKEAELESELMDWRYRSIIRVSELTQFCRQSQLEQKLWERGDTTLISSKVAPYIIRR